MPEFIEQEHPRDSDGKFTDKGEDMVRTFIDPRYHQRWDDNLKKIEDLKTIKNIDYYLQDIKTRQKELSKEFDEKLDGLEHGSDEYNKVMKVLEKKELDLMDEEENMRLDPKYDDISPVDENSYDIIVRRRRSAQPLSESHEKLLVKIKRIHNDVINGVKNKKIQSYGVKTISEEMAIKFSNNQVDAKISALREARKVEQRKILEEQAELLLGVGQVNHYNEKSPVVVAKRLKEKYGDIQAKKEEAMKKMVDAMGKGKNIHNDPILKQANDDYQYWSDMEDSIPESESKFLKDLKSAQDVLDEQYTPRGHMHLRNEFESNNIRNGGEVLTPLVTKGIHIYAPLDKLEGAIPVEVIARAHDLLKQTARQNFWIKNEEHSFKKQRMHYELISGNGYEFNVGDKKFRSGAHWSEARSAIRVFNAKTVRNVEYSYHHEFSHAQWDALEQRFNYDERNNKQGAMNTFKKEVEKLDPKFANDVFGSYFTSYLTEWQKGNRKGKVSSVHTEAFAHITDIRRGERSGHHGYNVLQNKYPKLVSAYERLKGESGNVREMFASEVEKVNDSVVYDEDIYYLDDNFDIVSEEMATIVFKIGYNKFGRMVAKTRYLPTIANEFNDKHDPNTGQFATKDGSSNKINDFKKTIEKRVEPKPEVKAIQEEVSNDVKSKVWQAIDKLGIRDKIHDVAMQGSFEKGTDLPTSGSDLDLFVVFKTDVPENEREELGVKIGMSALDGKDPYIQNATTKYAEAYFTHKGQDMEVQVVPTRHLTLEQIKNRELNGKPISIGMERTPHQTAFMKQALKGKEHEVRILKQFMKDTGLYDSSMKSQGFSGYSAEVLIHNFGSFENTLNFFANFKSGSIVGGEKGNDSNIFSLIDPIDPNRDLISAFSPIKIGRTIKVAKHFLEHGEPPKRSEPVELPSVSLSYKTTQFNEDTLVGQVRRTQKSIVKQLEKLGFNIPSQEEKITDDFIVDVPRTSMSNDNNKITMTFGTNDLEIPKTYIDRGVPLSIPKAVDSYRKANAGLKFIEEDGKLKAIKTRPFTHLADALKYLATSEGDVQQTGVTADMKKGITTSIGKSKFENLI